MKKNLTPAEYGRIVDQMEQEFVAHLAKFESEQTTLAKSEEKDDESKESDEPKESKDEPKAEAESAEPKAEAKEESKDEPKAEAEAPRQESESEDDSYSPEDLEEMHKMYHSMSKNAQRSHLQSLRSSMSKSGWSDEEIQKCWSDNGSAMEKCGEIEAPKPEAPKAMEKSDAEVLRKENDELKKNIEEIVGSLNKHFTAKIPQQKAITSVDSIEKSETEVVTLSKSEVTQKLMKRLREPASLSKADRETIKQYYNQSVGIEKIQHLLN